MKSPKPYFLFLLLGLLWLWGVAGSRPVLAQSATPTPINPFDIATLVATLINPLLSPIATSGLPPASNPGGSAGTSIPEATTTPIPPTATVTPSPTVTLTATAVSSPTATPTLPPTATVLPTVTPVVPVVAPAGTESTPLGWGITALAAGFGLAWVGFILYLVWRSVHPARRR